MPLKLARQGRREILLGSLLLLAACAVLIVLFWPLAVVPLALWLWVLWFFRDPDRPAPQMSAGLVSPADGHISDITPIGPESELGRPGVRIGIFMSVFDVHVNRSPAPARVESVVHRKGAFLDARDPQASERNESATIRLTCNRAGVDYPLVVRQVAGLLARRIVTELAPGQSLLRGQRIGMIKFGSRVEVLAPPELAGKIFVELGQKVLAGQTVLAAGMSEPGSD